MAKINFGKSDFQFAQLDKEFEPHIASIFNKTYGRNVSILKNINVGEVIILDIQLTMNIL